MREKAWRERAEDAEREVERLNAVIERLRRELTLPERIDAHCRRRAAEFAATDRTREGEPGDRTYARHVEGERSMAARCLHEHGELGMGHPGCEHCPLVHGFRYEMVC